MAIETKDSVHVRYLIDRLQKDCTNSKGYLGVEYDNLEIDADCLSYTESLFNSIMIEMNVLSGNPGEYVESEYSDYDAPFRTYRNAQQHVNRLRKYVEKYAPKYLDEQTANRFIRESKGY